MKFKKHISILLSFFLLVSNVGFAVDVHYCGGEVASIKPVYWENLEASKTVEKSCCASKVEKKEHEGKVFLTHEVGLKDEKNAPYIKNNKIYSSDNKILTLIEGKEIYGAAWYLINN